MFWSKQIPKNQTDLKKKYKVMSTSE